MELKTRWVAWGRYISDDTQFGGSDNFVDGSVGVNKTEEWTAGFGGKKWLKKCSALFLLS